MVVRSCGTNAGNDTVCTDVVAKLTRAFVHVTRVVSLNVNIHDSSYVGTNYLHPAFEHLEKDETRN